MDSLTFWDHFTGHVVALLTAYAWPIVVFVVVLSQHKAFSGLIKAIESLKFKWGDKEASVAMRSLAGAVDDAEASADKPAANVVSAAAPAPQVEDAKPADPVPDAPRTTKTFSGRRLKFRDAAWEAPAVAIERSWQQVRIAVYKLLGIDKTATSWFELDGVPDEQLIAKLKADPRVDAALLRAIVELKMIRNDATTTIGWQPTTSEGHSYRESALRVVELVDQVATKKKPDEGGA